MWHAGSGIMAMLCYYAACAKLSLVFWFFLFVNCCFVVFRVSTLPSSYVLYLSLCTVLLIPSKDNAFRLQVFQMLRAKHYTCMNCLSPGTKRHAQFVGGMVRRELLQLLWLVWRLNICALIVSKLELEETCRS